MNGTEDKAGNEWHDTKFSFAQLLALLFPCETFFDEMRI